MKVVFAVNVIFPAGGRGTPYASFRQEFDLEVQPHPGVSVEHSTWHEPRGIDSIHLNLEEQSFFVVLAPERPNDQRSCDALIEIYRSHGWEELGT